MGFLSPWFLAGLAGVGLPVWLHLLRRHRSKPLPFSSLMFFERRTQSSVRHRRLEYLLLFALRTALLVLIALAFANPFIRSAAPIGAADAKRVVLAVDNSFSMREGGRLEKAKREALDVAGRLQGGDRAEVLAFAAQTHFLTQPTREGTELRAAIQTIEATDSRSSFGELVRVLRLAAGSARVPLEVHLFSDLQKSALPPAFADLRLPAGARLVLHPSADSAPPNWAVESVSAPRRIHNPKRARIQATVAGYGAEPARRRVSLVLNGKTVETKDVEIPANGRAAVEFVSLDAPHGLSRGEVRIDSADTLPQDDRYLFAVERAESRPVLFIHAAQERRALLYFRAALEASPDAPFRLEEAGAETAGGLALEKYAFVVLSDTGPLPRRFEEALRAYVEAGGSAWIALGPVTTGRRRVPVLGAETVDAKRDTEPFRSVSYLDPAHPSVRRANAWEGVKFFRVVRTTHGAGRVLARLSDETPVLLEQKLGEGRVLVFASTFDNISNDFPLHASFVPFVEQTAQYLGGLEDGSSGALVDSFLELRKPGSRSAALEVIDPQGRRALSLAESATATALPLSREGFYELHRANGKQELVAVNADRRESDLEGMGADTLSLWQKTGEGATGSVSGASDEETAPPRSLWWYVVGLALLLGLAESYVANRHLTEAPGVIIRAPEQTVIIPKEGAA
jgi:hypothetical protein